MEKVDERAKLEKESLKIIIFDYKSMEDAVKVSVRPLNKGEMFCCSIKAVKDLFGNSDVHADFAYYGRDYRTMVGTVYDAYHKKYIKGRVISSFEMQSDLQNPILAFYVVREKDFTTSLKREFESTCLPELFKLYTELRNESNIINSSKCMLVELYNNKIIVHKYTV